MWSKRNLAWMAVAGLAGIGGLTGCDAAIGDKQPVTPNSARPAVELTVYTQDFGMVREVRPMQLAQGSNKLRVTDVSKQLDPQSVLLRWQAEGTKGANLPQLVAHTYDLGVGDGNGLLKRYVGQEVEVVRYGNDGKEAERQRGTLMVQENGETVVQSEGHFYVHPNGTISAPANDSIVTIPQLSVQAESKVTQSANLEVAYLTRGLAWSADYVATLAPQGSALSLECWATVTNRTGVDYPNATVSLIAGTPNRAVLPAEERAKQVSNLPASPGGSGSEDGNAVLHAARSSAKREAAIEAPEAVGEFHAYKIKNQTTIAQDQMNRLLMLSGPNVSVIKDYSATPPDLSSWDDYGYGWGTVAKPGRGQVGVALTFFNTEKEGLGTPLPHGAIRIYEPDKSGALHYAGAATLSDTPKDEKVNITLARAFDVFTEWRLVKKQRIDKKTVRKQVELILHNEKDTAVDLRIVQSLEGRWKMIAEPDKHINLDASRVQWKTNVPAGGKVTFSYTVDFPL